jgi:hypothetical protein
VLYSVPQSEFVWLFPHDLIWINVLARFFSTGKAEHIWKISTTWSGTFLLCLQPSFFFLWYWGLNVGPTPWVTPSALFCDGFFCDRVSWTICPGWLRTAILLISASWVARITGVSHCCPAVYSPLLLTTGLSSALSQALWHMTTRRPPRADRPIILIPLLWLNNLRLREDKWNLQSDSESDLRPTPLPCTHPAQFLKSMSSMQWGPVIAASCWDMSTNGRTSFLIALFVFSVSLLE